MFQTYQTKLKNDHFVLPNGKNEQSYRYYEAYAIFFGRLERKLFVDLYVRKKPSNDLKPQYCSFYQITARQYNSIKNQLDGRVKSVIEKRHYDIEELTEKIKQTSELIERKIKQKDTQQQALLKMKGNEATFLKKVTKYRRLKEHIHQKRRKWHRMTVRLEKLKEDISKDIIRLCFGTKKLFQKQFHLAENQLTMDEWKQMWREKRASQFTFIGSKDETFGNQTCTYDAENNLRIRVSTKDEATYGKYVTIPNVTFPYGQPQLDVAKIPYMGYTKGKGTPTKYYRALTAKFIKQNGVWYLNMSVDVDEPTLVTIRGNGTIGIDLNAQFLAVTEVDRFGNVVHSFIVPFRGYHVTSEQTKQSLSEALKVIVQYAIEKQKPIICEDLNFQKKKQQLKECTKKQAKLLSGFAYSLYKQLLEAKCKKAGVELVKINPAYTSQMGHHKYMKRYGLSSHESAAMVIARKAMRFVKTEKVPTRHIIKGKKEKIVLKSRLAQWKDIMKQWKQYTFKQKTYLLYKGL